MLVDCLVTYHGFWGFGLDCTKTGWAGQADADFFLERTSLRSGEDLSGRKGVKIGSEAEECMGLEDGRGCGACTAGWYWVDDDDNDGAYDDDDAALAAI